MPFDDSIFLSFFKMIELLYTEILPNKILSKKSIFAKIFEILKVLIFSCLAISIILAILIVLIYLIKQIDNFILAVFLIALSVILTVAVVSITLILSIHSAEFLSFQDEIDVSNEYNFEKHTIIAVLKKTDKDIFVLADFKSKHELRPAVFTKKNNTISLINLKTKTTYYKKIYLGDYDEFEYIRIQRLENKTTKTKMIFFASTVNNLKIHFNNQLIPKIDCGNKLGKFSIYGMIENDDSQNVNTVNINGCDYSIIETPVKYYFINKNEI